MAEWGPRRGAIETRGPTGSLRYPDSNGWQMSNDHTTTATPGGISQAYTLTWPFSFSSSPPVLSCPPRRLYLFVSLFLTRTLSRARCGIDSVSRIEMLSWPAYGAPFSNWIHTYVHARVYARAYTQGPRGVPGERTGRTHRCYGTTGRTLVKRLVAARPPSPAVKVALATARV